MKFSRKTRSSIYLTKLYVSLCNVQCDTLCAVYYCCSVQAVARALVDRVPEESVSKTTW